MIKIKIMKFNYVIDIITCTVFNINFFKFLITIHFYTNVFIISSFTFFNCDAVKWLFWSIFCMIKITTKANNNKQQQAYDYWWNSINKATTFCRCYFLSLRKTSVVFDILSSHSNTNLPIRRFSQEQFLVCKHSLVLHALLHSQPQLLGFHI